MKRREFVGLATAAMVAPAFAARAAAAVAIRPDISGLKVRKVGNVEIAYKSPHAKPNGLQATPAGLWDIGPSRLDSSKIRPRPELRRCDPRRAAGGRCDSVP